MIGQIAGSIIGGLFQKKAAKKARQNALFDEAMKFIRLRDAAERGGFNPLTALENGGVGGFSNLPSGVAPLASTAIITGALQGVGEMLSSKRETKMTEQDVRDDLLKVENERKGAGGYEPVIRRSKPGAGNIGVTPVSLPPVTVRDAPPRTGKDPFRSNAVEPGTIAPFPDLLEQIRGPQPAPKVENVSEDVPADVTRQHIGPMRQSVTMKDGSIYTFPVLQEPEEILAGYASEWLHDRPWLRKALNYPAIDRQAMDKFNQARDWYTSPAQKSRRDKTKKTYNSGIPAYMKD